jgi:hypothetical protein
VCRRTGHTMVGVRLLPLPQHLIHLSSQFAAPKPNLPILGSYNDSAMNRREGRPMAGFVEGVDRRAASLLGGTNQVGHMFTIK